MNSTISASSLDLTKHSGKGAINIKPTQIQNIVSPDTAILIQKINQRRTSETIPSSVSIAEVLFDARAIAKETYSYLSVHLPPTLKNKLFKQIDLIHDDEDWEEGEQPIKKVSLLTFLRWFYITSPEKLPNFGLSQNGNLIASWLANDNHDKLILEFGRSDHISWFLEKHIDDDIDRSTGSTNLKRINKVIEPYNPEAWFSNNEAL